MQYRPTAAELLDAIAELLEKEVIDAVSGPVQHKVRVAANLARILQRESELGPQTIERERAVVTGLLDRSDDGTDLLTLRGELANRLRQSDPADERVTWAALVEITKGDLAIAKPGHAEWTGDA